MKFVFSKLPQDIIKYILLFNENFIIRNGKLVTIIPKTDYRYNLLNFITFKKDYIEHFYDDSIRYNYYFNNLYNYDGRYISNSDIMQVKIKEENDNTIKYNVWFGRQKPKSIMSNKHQIYFVENDNYHWIYIEYEYTRS